MRKLRWVLPLMVVAVLATAATAAYAMTDGQTRAEAPSASRAPVTIRMGWGIPAEEIKYVMMSNPSVAPNMGKYYNVEWHQFAGTALGVQGIAAGTLDCATVGGLSSANGIDQGAKLVLLGEFIEERKPYFSTTWMVRKDSGINSLADLKGKTVATSAIGGSTDYIQDFYIEQHSKLKPSRDYTKVEVPFGQMQESLLSGRIDMGLFPQPFYSAINATGKVKPMFKLVDEINPFVQLMNGCSKDFVDKNPVAIQKFQQDWVRVADWIRSPANRDQVIAASSGATKIPASVLQPFLLTQDDFYRPAHGAISVSALQKEWDFFYKQGGIKQKYDVKNFLSKYSVTDLQKAAPKPKAKKKHPAKPKKHTKKKHGH